LLAGCGGGSGEDTTQTEISTNAISFSAGGPTSEAPAPQVFTATFGKDIEHLAVVHSGDAIESVTSVINGRTAEITVVPAAPGTIGPGAFVGAVAVTGYTCADATCSQLSAGSTATVSVSYQVSPLIARVTPYVATAGTSDTIVIRGAGFLAFNVTGVRFGDVAATNFTVDGSGVEIRATYPALPAGSYTIHIDSSNHQGEIPSSVSLLVQDPIAYPATTLAHVPSTTTVRSLAYDAERRALLLVTDATGGPIVRYAYENGAWSAPTQTAGPFLDAALTADGKQIYAITATALVPVDPVTLALGTAVTAPSPVENTALKNIVVGNDNRALITTSLTASGTSEGYLYDTDTNQMVFNRALLDNGTPAMAGNGTVGIVVQGDPALTSDPAVYIYTPLTNQTQSSAQALLQNSVAPAMDRGGTRAVLNGTRVYDTSLALTGALTLMGKLPDSTSAVAFNPSGSRTYAYDPTAGGILVYDTSKAVDEAGNYTALGPVTPLVGDPGSNVRMTITADGGTLFIAGSAQIVVQPTPAQ
jgi:hypothetical protein